VTFALLYSPGLREYDFGPGHPFRGNRYDIFRPFLQQHFPAGDAYTLMEAEPASDSDLLLICSREYIDAATEIYRAAAAGTEYYGDLFRFQSGDNMPIGTPGKIEEAARLIIGQAKKACDSVCRNEFAKVVSIGGGLHHAGPDYGEGFCIYNDVAFCGRYLRREHGLERVLILDTDAHAGNGTSRYFYEEPEVLFIDIHQDPRTIYPGTGFAGEIGSGRGRGFNINIPMPPYSGYDEYKMVFEEIVEPVISEYRPQIIVRNGGSDPHFADSLTSLGLPLRGFRMIGEKVREMAEICGGRVIDLTASGYNLNVLPYGWLALIAGLFGKEVDLEEPEPPPESLLRHSSVIDIERVIGEVRNNLREYWDCLR
jgi:acetoin utilization protein AcuC